MLTVAVINTKGGVGKSTLTCNLAVAAKPSHDRVGVLDLDPQRTLSGWWERRGRPADILVLADAASAADGAKELERRGYTLVLIDTPPAFLRHVREAAQVADVCVIPIRPASFDLDAARDAIAICEEEGKPYAIVINDVHAGEKFAAETRTFLDSEEVPVLKSEVRHRPAYVSSVVSGKVAGEMQGSHQAKAEMAALWSEIEQLATDAKAPPSKRKAGTR